MSTNGVNSAAVKQGYEVALASDSAIVVTVSPNSPAVAPASLVTANQGLKGADNNAWPVALPDPHVLPGQVTASTSLSAVVATGPAASASDLGCARSTVTAVLSGTATAATVDLEASLDGTTFFVAVAGTSHNLSTGAVAQSVNTVAARYWRANVKSVAGGNVTALITGA